jgi:hypothetical protein
LDRFKIALQACTQNIQDSNSLRERVQKLIEAFGGELVRRPIDPDVEGEYIRQHSYLERTAVALKKQLQQEIASHREENDRLMATNMQLIKDIARERDENQKLKNALHAKLGAAQQKERMRKNHARRRNAARHGDSGRPGSEQLRTETQELRTVAEKNRQYIARLRMIEEALQRKPHNNQVPTWGSVTVD